MRTTRKSALRGHKSLGSLIFFLGLVLGTTGCATIIKGTKETVSVNTSPAVAQVSVHKKNGPEIGVGETPYSILLAKSSAYEVFIRVPGYQELRVVVDQEFDGWVLANLVCGGLVGFLVDYISGGAWELEPNHIVVQVASATSQGTEGTAAKEAQAILLARDRAGDLRALVVPLLADATRS